MNIIEPHIYLDTNVILDAIYQRHIPSVELLDRIKNEGWKCSTSRFTVLEMLDFEQEKAFEERLVQDGVQRSRIRDYIGRRRQEKWGLDEISLGKVWQSLNAKLAGEYAFIDYEHSVGGELWDEAEKFCAATNIGAFDAIQLAFAICIGCNILVTHDQDFQPIADKYIIASA
jgi:predicted nucleic acid-binding protein